MIKNYTVLSLNYTNEDLLDWDAPLWRKLNIATIDKFHSKSTDHHPETQVRIGYDQHNIYVMFQVKDAYVRSLHTEYNSKVNEDTCVEWFLQPPNSKGYYNFEMNAGGTLHVNYIIDPTRDKNGKRKNIKPIPEDHANIILIKSTLPSIVDPEIKDSITWHLSMIIPFKFFDLYTPVKKINSSIWRGNLYKCGDLTSHPHWGCWNPVKELNFHQPKHFGEFRFLD